MKTPRKTLLALLAAALLPSGAALAQQAGDTSGVDASFRAGMFQPSEAAFEQAYGGSRIPLVMQVDWRVHRVLALFGGVRYLGLDGRAIAEDDTAAVGASGEAVYATHLALTSARLGALAVVTSGRWDVRVGGGLNVEHYAEEWPAAAASASGTRTGWLAQATAARRIGRRFSAGVSVEYSGVAVPAGTGESAVPALDLGGLDVLLTAGIRF
jgi:hypothetical protein